VQISTHHHKCGKLEPVLCLVKENSKSNKEGFTDFINLMRGCGGVYGEEQTMKNLASNGS
jgi:hypothetical protein